MDLNISRIKKYIMCSEAAFQLYHEHRTGGVRPTALVMGTAYHAGFAEWQVSHDWAATVRAAEVAYNKEGRNHAIDTKLDFDFIANWEIVKSMLEVSKEQRQKITMLQPECEFSLAIPGSEHNDITVHWMERIDHEGKTGSITHSHSEYVERWGMPDPLAIRERRVHSPHHNHTEDCDCWRPHTLYGKVDGVISIDGKIWLQEHKTTSMMDQKFWDQWYLDLQLTAYVYAMWKTLGTKPAGVMLNAVRKPTDAQVAQWTKNNGKSMKDYLGYQSQFFARTEADCERFERQFIALADKWEYDILHGTFVMEPGQGHCYAYNRRCDYFDMCHTHQDEVYTELLQTRQPDYVDNARAQTLINIQGNK